MLDDLRPQPSISDLSKYWGVCPRTVRRWIAADLAPRPAMVALFWCTRWGHGLIGCDTSNELSMYASAASSARSECNRLRRELARVLAVADFGCANSPSFTAPTVAELLEAQARQARRLTQTPT